MSRTDPAVAAANAAGSDSPLQITEVLLRIPPDPSGSVVAYASCVLNGYLALNDIRIERGRESGLVIVYPSRPSASGKRHRTFHPVTRDAGEAIRQALLAGLQRLIGPAGDTDVGLEDLP